MLDPAVYLLANRHMGTLYVGVTGNLIRRVGQHRSGIEGGFACRYGLARLVWFEQHVEMRPAIEREKQIKKWRREWKIALIEAVNPTWRDLWPEIIGQTSGFPLSRE